MSAFEQAIKDNGFTIIEGVKYALFQEPYLDNSAQYGRKAYRAVVFAADDLSTGNFDPLFDSMVAEWDCTDWWNDGKDYIEFDCDWENGATLHLS